jgi:hypothetical protein
MYKNLEILNKTTHKDGAVEQIKSFTYAKEIINAPITVAEFFEACKDYPIFFAKDTNQNWTATVMLGYKEKENVFVDKDGKWEENRYVPAFVRRYPFIFVTNPNSDDLTLAFDKECLSASKEDEVRRFFDDSGKNTEFLNNVLNFLSQFQNDAKATSEFIKQLENWEILEEKVATIVNQKQEKYSINGFYVVNEEKLKHLSKKKKEAICNNNATPLITAHLLSLSNIQKVGNR